MLVEQGDGTIVTPKMNEVNVRTMEFCRRWGIADQVHNCPFPARPRPRRGVRHEPHRLRARPHAAAGGRGRQTPEPYSPMRLQTCSQMWFDPILRDFALSSPCVQLRHRTRLEAFEDTGAGVDRRDRRSRKRRSASASRPIIWSAATAPRARSAAQLGIGLTGQGVLGHPLHLFFRAPDFLKRCGKAEGTFFLAIDRGGLWANIRVVDPVNAMWRLMVLDTDGKQTPETIDQDGADPPRGRPAVRGRMAEREHLDAGAAWWRNATTRAGCFSPATPCISSRRPARSA